jgi:hypothetical protein
MPTYKKPHDLYHTDIHLWFMENAKLLKQNKFDLVDINHVVEELESMGRSECDKLEILFTILFLHLLKLKYQSFYEVGIRSWILSVKEHRRRIERHLAKNPSLKGHMKDIIQAAYEDARFEAARETGLKEEVFPKKMPFTVEQALKDNWFP